MKMKSRSGRQRKLWTTDSLVRRVWEGKLCLEWQIRIRRYPRPFDAYRDLMRGDEWKGAICTLLNALYPYASKTHARLCPLLRSPAPVALGSAGSSGWPWARVKQLLERLPSRRRPSRGEGGEGSSRSRNR